MSGPKPETTIPKFLKPLDGYPGAFIERLDELGPTSRVTWVPDQRQTITLAGNFTADQLRQMADMMETAIGNRRSKNHSRSASAAANSA